MCDKKFPPFLALGRFPPKRYGVSASSSSNLASSSNTNSNCRSMHIEPDFGSRSEPNQIVGLTRLSHFFFGSEPGRMNFSFFFQSMLFSGSRSEMNVCWPFSNKIGRIRLSKKGSRSSRYGQSPVRAVAVEYLLGLA